MSAAVEAFDQWIRTAFVEMNTALEHIYVAEDDPLDVIGRGDSIKDLLRGEGHRHIAALLAEGNTGEGFESGFGVRSAAPRRRH